MKEESNQDIQLTNNRKPGKTIFLVRHAQSTNNVAKTDVKRAWTDVIHGTAITTTVAATDAAVSMNTAKGNLNSINICHYGHGFQY